jgi:hypothetical protein
MSERCNGDHGRLRGKGTGLLLERHETDLQIPYAVPKVVALFA